MRSSERTGTNKLDARLRSPYRQEGVADGNTGNRATADSPALADGIADDRTAADAPVRRWGGNSTTASPEFPVQRCFGCHALWFSTAETIHLFRYKFTPFFGGNKLWAYMPKIFSAREKELEKTMKDDIVIDSHKLQTNKKEHEFYSLHHKSASERRSDHINRHSPVDRRRGSSEPDFKFHTTEHAFSGNTRLYFSDGARSGRS